MKGKNHFGLDTGQPLAVHRGSSKRENVAGMNAVNCIGTSMDHGMSHSDCADIGAGTKDIGATCWTGFRFASRRFVKEVKSPCWLAGLPGIVIVSNF
jgi:hypothetical protein